MTSLKRGFHEKRRGKEYYESRYNFDFFIFCVFKLFQAGIGMEKF